MTDSPTDLLFETSATFDEEFVFRVRGHVDQIDAENGIVGWAVDLDQPKAPVILELVVGDEVIAETTTSLPRPGIVKLLGQEASPGFQFQTAELIELQDYISEGTSRQIGVRVRGSDFALPPLSRMPQLLELAASFDAHERTPQPVATANAAVMSRLAELHAFAKAILTHPLRPMPENTAGFIEVVSVDGSGLVWIAGWLKRGHALLTEVAIADGAKFSAAMMLTSHEREDLPADAYGVVGVLATEWQPDGTSEPFIYFGSAGRFHLRPTKPLPRLTPAEFSMLLETLLPNCTGDHTPALHHLLRAPTSWLMTQGGGEAVQTGLDLILVLPNFGCFVDGWVLSPLKPVRSFLLRLGDKVLANDPAATYFKPREDLAAILPNAAHLLRQAGFVACFPGRIQADDLTRPMFKIVYIDGSSTTHPVELTKLRRIGTSAMVEDLLPLYPTLKAETFFPALAQALREDGQARHTAPVPFMVEPMPRAIVFSVSDERQDGFLLFDAVTRHWRGKSGVTGLVFLVGQAVRYRADVLSLVDELRAETSIPVSVFFVDDDPPQLFANLAAVLQMITARRFLFVPAGVLPKHNGWEDAEPLLIGPLNRLDIIDIPRAIGDGFGVGEELGTEMCFAWSRVAFCQWGGIFGGSKPTKALPLPTSHPSPITFGRRTRVRTPGKANEWMSINQQNRLPG